MVQTKKVQATTDVNNDGVIDEKDTIEVVIDDTTPKVFGWVAGKPVHLQEHPDNKNDNK